MDFFVRTSDMRIEKNRIDKIIKRDINSGICNEGWINGKSIFNPV